MGSEILKTSKSKEGATEPCINKTDREFNTKVTQESGGQQSEMENRRSTEMESRKC